MPSESYLASKFYQNYQIGINNIKSQNKDFFHNKLYFSHVISLLEKYLHDLFIHEISSNRNALIKLASHNNFRGQSLKIPFLLHNKVEDYMIHAMKNFVWHRLNDVDAFYKNVMGIQLNISDKLLDKVDVRHDIVHRNGFNLDNNPIEISAADLSECIELTNDFIVDVDRKYHIYRHKSTNVTKTP